MSRRRTFAGSVVLVTGAAGGLGHALCRRFGQEGATIAAIDRDRKGLASLTRTLEDDGVEHATITCDLTDPPSTRDAVEALRDRLGPIDVLVNNAGITHLARFGSDQVEPIRRVVEVNFFGAVHTTAACCDDLVARRGLMIAVSSVAGYAPLVGRTGYAASKHALQGFCNTLRSEWRGTGADVLVVCPSFIATGIRAAFEHQDGDGDSKQSVGANDSPEAVADRIVKAARIGRRQISTGRVGALAAIVWRFAPRLYERLMLRSIRTP